jgi:hypothetical protein
MVLVERRARLADVDSDPRVPPPRQRYQPIQIRADDRVLGRGRRQALEAAQLALGLGARLVAQRRGGDLLA